MTRRGSLIYYLTAWICGCFFMSLTIWVHDMWGAAMRGAQMRQAFGLMFFYFYGLIFGAFATLFGAFLLRRVAAGLRCKTPLHWAIFGAIISPALIALLGKWGHHLASGDRPGLRLDAFFLFGPKTALEAGSWLAIPAGAATGYLLARVERAFEQPATPAPPISA
jgi:hypothetical protein